MIAAAPAAMAAPPTTGASAPSARGEAARTRPGTRPPTQKADQYALRPADDTQAPTSSFGLRPKGFGGRDDGYGAGGLGRSSPYDTGR